jgi:hypothetical protein
MPPIPFRVETIDQMTARFPKALEKIWIPKEGMEDRPGLHREHVFDFISGLRLLVSRDRLSPHKTQIHISASWEIYEPNTFEEATRQVTNAYRAIGGKGVIHFLGMSSGKIPHWLVEDES